MIPADLLARYGLPEDEAARVVEDALSRVLSGAFGREIVARVGRTVEVFPVSRDQEATISLEGISKQLRRQIRYQIERGLEYRQAVRERDCLRALQGQVIPGEVARLTADGGLLVKIEVPDHFRRLVATGICPVRGLPPHERDEIRAGRVAFFHVTSVVLDRQGHTPKVRVNLSRSSRALPVLLLREETGEASLRCRRRIAGAFSEIETAKPLPKTAILAVGKELRERIIIRVLDQKAS